MVFAQGPILFDKLVHCEDVIVIYNAVDHLSNTDDFICACVENIVMPRFCSPLGKRGATQAAKCSGYLDRFGVAEKDVIISPFGGLMLIRYYNSTL